MPTNTKIVLWIVVAVVVVGGAWWWLSMSQTAVAPANQNITSQNNPSAQTQTGGTAGANGAAPQTNGVSATDNSNAALQTDLSNIDSQMNSFASDNASVNQGLSDQPVQQAQL